MLSKYSKIILLILILTLTVTALTVTVCADIEFSENNSGNENSLFVAGNPNLYPIEYYNPLTGKYEGMLPQLYERISEQTGIDFTYIYSSSDNKQAYLAENKQVDIVSAHLADREITKNTEDCLLLGFYENGVKHEVMIGFTSVCPSESKADILSILKSISAEDMTAITVGYVRENNYGQIPLLLWTFVILVILVVLLIAVALLGKKYLSLRKKFRYGEMYDIKTGIYNRSYFMYLFDKKVSMEARPAYYLAHIALDPERMRRCYGQDQAEQIAFYTAKALRATVERGEYCARLGDLSFAYLMRCAKPEIAEAKIGAFIRKINAENGILREGYQVEFHAGVYHCTRFYEESYRILDVAAETYVRAQRNELPYLFATDDMIHAEDRYGRMQREIIQAIKNGEIQYYLQYVVNIKTSEVCGAEAISRWQHPREGLLMPGDYIPIMQQANIISMLDYYIFEKTCRQLERWGRMPDRRDFFVSCNFDSQTIAEENFFEKVSDIASRYTFDRKKLLLEMTMDTLESDRETAYQNACRCSNAGFSLALDDFGRSFSSISTLLDFPISLLKLDRSFVDLITTERGYRLVEGIVSTARSVGFELLFEGIETEEQCETVKKLGVYYVQGFFFSRVVPQIEADRTLARLFSRLNGKEAEDLFSDPESAAIFDGNLKLFRRVGYSKSFEVMRKQADGSIVELYNEIHHKLMSCMGASSKISMVYETISVGKKPIAKLIFLSNSLIVCLALPPEEYFGTKYPFKDVSYNKKYQSVPFCLKVTDRKSMEDVLELAEVFTKRYAPTIK